jgi:hypothetical protein
MTQATAAPLTRALNVAHPSRLVPNGSGSDHRVGFTGGPDARLIHFYAAPVAHMLFIAD